MSGLIVFVYFPCLRELYYAIKDSSRRLLSLGYALGGVVLVLVLGLVATGAMFLLTPSRTVAEVNAVLDMIGMTIAAAAPIAAVIGAYQPPRRVKA